MKFGGTVRVETLQHSTKTTALRREADRGVRYDCYLQLVASKRIERVPNLQPAKGGEAVVQMAITDIRVESLAVVTGCLKVLSIQLPTFSRDISPLEGFRCKSVESPTRMVHLSAYGSEQIALVPIEHVHLSYVPESRGGRFDDH